jgi:calcium-dependent protein kinase
VLQGHYDAKCDIWSIGVIAYMLLSGAPPFFGKTDADTLQSVKIGRWKFDPLLFGEISQEAKDFISGCLTKRVSKRMSASEALAHPWFTSWLKTHTTGVAGLGSPTVSLDVVDRLRGFVKRSSLTKICMEVVAVGFIIPFFCFYSY